MYYKNLYIQTMAEFEPLAEELKNAILSSGGGRKTAAPTLDDVRKFFSENTAMSNAAIGGIAGLAVGAVSGASAQRRPWESESEFRRRRFRAAMGHAVAVGAVAGFARPAFEKYTELVGDVEAKAKGESYLREAEKYRDKNQDILERSGAIKTEKSKETDERVQDTRDAAAAYLSRGSSEDKDYLWSGSGAIGGGVVGYRQAGEKGLLTKGLQLAESAPGVGAKYNLTGIALSEDPLKGSNFFKAQRPDTQLALNDPEQIGNVSKKIRERIGGAQKELTGITHTNVGGVDIKRNPTFLSEKDKARISELTRKIRDDSGEVGALKHRVGRYHGRTGVRIANRVGGTLLGSGVGAYASGKVRSYLHGKANKEISDAIKRNTGAARAREEAARLLAKGDSYLPGGAPE